MKVGLINPGWTYSADPMNADLYHLPGIAYVSAALKEAGYEVTNVDFANDENARLDQVKDCEVVGVASYVNSYRFLRENLPILQRQGAVVVVGGPLISSYGIDKKENLLMRTFPEIDFGVIGEGEKAVVGLCKFLEGRTELPRGVIYRDGIGLRNTGRSEIVENLDDVPEVDYNDWPALRDNIRGHTLNFLTSRGCYNRCSFCFKPQKGVRSFSLSRIERELHKLVDLKPRHVCFGDDVFTYDSGRAIAVGRLAQRFGFPYNFESRVNDVSSDLARELAKTGCRQIKFGIESFDQRVLDRNGKHVKVRQIYDAIRMTQDAGMEASGFFLFGLPGETRESIEATLRGIEQTRVMPRARLLIPLPGTEIYKQAVREGKINELDFLKSLSEPEHFDTTRGNWVPINLTDGVSDKELLEARDTANSLRKNFSLT